MNIKRLPELALLTLGTLLVGCGADDATPPAPKAVDETALASAAERWAADEFQPSTLSADAQLEELAWFRQAGAPFRGMRIRVVSETLTTHEYESETLTRAFEEITGIEVTHDLIQEGDVIERLQTQMQSGENIYDAYVNDSDLIGTHARYGYVVPLSDFMAGEGADVTLPTLDLNDFIGKSFTTGPDGKLYQLPDQQFANLYWFRADWFARDDLKAQFRERYGYELGVPENWSAYEDIAEFFSVHVGEIDGERVYGHMDYGKKDPSLGWRFTDAWLSMAGAGDAGIPNGLPVDEWGIRVEGCRPAGSAMSRGGAANGPAAVYALIRKWDMEWLQRTTPRRKRGLLRLLRSRCRRSGAGQRWPSRSSGTPPSPPTWSRRSPRVTGTVMNDDGNAAVADGAVAARPVLGAKAMKVGYQDVGSWTILKSTPLDRAQGRLALRSVRDVSKTVDVRKKTHVGLTLRSAIQTSVSA